MTLHSVGSPYECPFRIDLGKNGRICQFDALPCNDNLYPQSDKCPLLHHECVIVISKMLKEVKE